MNTTRKFILFIVEGKNDEKEIEAILRVPQFKYLKEKYVYAFIKYNGDVTSDKNTTSSHVRKTLDNLVVNWRKKANPFNVERRDIHEIVQIIDMDGAFIPEDKIFFDKKAIGYRYEDSGIFASRPEDVIGRNRKKKEVITTLLDTKEIDNIPYSIYFASCNMDHLLFGERNPDRGKKSDFGNEFGAQLSNKPEQLKLSIFNPKIMTDKTWFNSWYEIRLGLNSLKRCTNINLFFTEGAKNPK